MKKKNLTCSIVALIVIVLCIAGATLVVLKDICPPQGPWPQPPWCDGSEQSFFPSLPGVSETKFSLTVTVPENTPEHSVIYIELFDDGVGIGNYAMTEIAPNVWQFASTNLDWEMENHGPLQYRYNRSNLGYWSAEEFDPDSPDTLRTIRGEDEPEIHDSVSKWRWMPAPGESLPDVVVQVEPFAPRIDNNSFQQGVVMADWWWDAFEPLIPSTNDQLLENNISSVELCPPWDYTQLDPTPVISNQIGYAYPDDKLRLHIAALQDAGIEIFLGPQICCTAVDTTALTPEWWEAWYEQYKGFLFYHIDLANEYGIENLSIGADWLVYVQQPEGFLERMDAIYDEAEARYDGKMGMQIYLGGNGVEGNYHLYPNPQIIPNLERWDFLSITWWAGISNSTDPSAEELDQGVEYLFQSFIDPLHEQYGVPIIFNQVAFSSVDGGLMGAVDVFDPAIQLWEPYADEFQLDLEEQAMGYDAILRGIARRDYVIGFYPFAYLPETFPLTLEFNLRDKPAEQVLRQWYESIP
jgi:hypothetical protein